MTLEFTQNGWYVLASIAVALMAAYTGLSFTKGASDQPAPRRKLLVVIAAVTLGGGIWTMHFVAMLGLQLPFQVYYDPLPTLISALLAILMVGLALLTLHFLPRSRATIALAGTITGLGIAVMHFIGMTGMELCRPVNGTFDYLLSGLAAVGLSVFAIWIAYDARRERNILLGTVGFALAVASVHYLAIAQTDFVADAMTRAAGPMLSNQSLAIGVTVAVFLICGAFLLMGVNLVERRPVAGAPPVSAPSAPPAEPAIRIPYQREGQTQFAPRDAVAAIRAEGHYTLLFLGDETLFCPWSLSEAETRLAPSGFVRTHRSYLVNPAHVAGFQRMKDSGVIWFDDRDSPARVPVSRSRIGPVREALGI